MSRDALSERTHFRSAVSKLGMAMILPRSSSYEKTNSWLILLSRVMSLLISPLQPILNCVLAISFTSLMTKPTVLRATICNIRYLLLAFSIFKFSFSMTPYCSRLQSSVDYWHFQVLESEKFNTASRRSLSYPN